MEEILKLDTISEYNTLVKKETLHPLVSVHHFENAPPRKLRRIQYGFYTVFLKQVKCGDLRYGMDAYDYQEGTLIFLAPGQVIGENKDEMYYPKGSCLLFHPDLIRGTALDGQMENYHFFSYAISEALHLSEKEKQTVLDCLAKISYELGQAIDKHSKQLIVANIRLFLDYCTRFYDRQFITRDNVHKGILERFDKVLNNYFHSGEVLQKGLPSVAYCAEQLNLSSNYFGDLVRKETDRSAHDFIHAKVIELAKEKLLDLEKPISDIAYELGFKYPQHFTRLFKQKAGVSPNEYRGMN